MGPTSSVASGHCVVVDGSPEDEPWYSVRCVIRSALPGSSSAWVYEERITLWRAASFDAAIERAEIDASEYANSLGAEYIGFAQAFHLFEGAQLGDGTEVFSLMRDSDLEPESYLERFFRGGSERENRVE